MSGVKLADLCADCCATDPTWASLTLGVLLCSRCAVVHLSLGQHFPRLVCFDDKLPAIQRELLEFLSVRNINSVWEHHLLNSNYTGGCRKPSPHDQELHPTRSAFIKSKYIYMDYIEKLPHDVTESQVNLQLLNTVCLSDVEESLKLILQGADPLFCDPDTKTSCLHAAVRSGHSLQVELLLIHGCDPRTVDTTGQSAIDIATASGRTDIVAQMVTALNQVRDKLRSFAENVKESSPPAPSPSSNLEIDDEIRAELSRDLYDELERRFVLSKCPCKEVPFLPVNKSFYSVRNQSRQKLALMNDKDLAALIHFCIGMKEKSSSHCETTANVVSNDDADVDDDEPLYDSVCGDEEIPPIDFSQEEFFPKSTINSPPSPAPSSPVKPPIFYANLLLKTEEITKFTHSLLVAAQSKDDSKYLSICKEIRSSCLQMSYLLPQSYPEATCRTALEALLNDADQLVESCEYLVGGNKTENAQSIIKLAYLVAKSVKTFVTSFPHIRDAKHPVN